MSFGIELHPKVVSDLQAFCEWYEERSQGLGIRLLDAVNKKLNEIAAHPEAYSKRKGNYREALTDTFPYVIIYEIVNKERIVFVSWIFHTKRNPLLKDRR